MEMENLKFNRKIAALVCGLALTEGITYYSFVKSWGKPFSKNEYLVHKTTSTEYSKDGIIRSEQYKDKLILKKAITLKTPYYKNIDGTIGRDVYNISASSYSDEEISFILNNVENQEILLDQEYIQSLIEKAKNPSNKFKFLRYEIINEIPKDNDYEISYTVYDEDLNDVKMYSSKVNDTLLTILYTLISSGEIFVGISYFNLLEDAQDNKQEKKKKLTKC